MLKSSTQDLAIFGADPAFGETLYVGRPNIGDRQLLMQRLEDILDRGWLTDHGPLVEESEGKLAECRGIRSSISTCTGTVGLEICISAAGG